MDSLGNELLRLKEEGKIMSWLRNLKTSFKLLAAFGLMAILMSLVGYQGIQGMAALKDTLDVMHQRHALGIDNVKEAEVQLKQISRMLLTVLIDDTLAAKQTRVVAIEKSRKIFLSELAKYRERTVLDTTKAKVDDLSQSFHALVAEQDKTIALGLAGKVVEAKASLQNLRAMADSVDEKMGELVSLKVELMEKDAVAAQDTYNSKRNWVMGVIIAAVLMALIFGVFLSSIIAAPLAQMVDAANKISVGDLNQSIEYESKDEVGTLAKAFRNLIAYIKEVATAADVLSEGDLTKKIAAQSDKDVLSNSFVRMKGNLEKMVGEIRQSSITIGSGASQISQGNADLSQRTQEQASALEETASSVEEMSSTVKQNADNARQANQLATSAREQAEKGGEVAAKAVAAMLEINTSSKRISDIISVIDGIAFQTNLLALNAAVEAARAGEQGRGFAVVAAEVRKLAQRSADAAKEISGLIKDSVDKVSDGSRLVDASGKALEEIVQSVKKVSDIVAEIAAASQEQSSGIEQINKAISQMDEVTQQNASLVEEAASASESMDAQARVLLQQIEFFKVANNGADNSKPGQYQMKARPVAETQAIQTPHEKSIRAGHEKSIPVRSSAAARQSTVKKSNGKAEEWAEF
jgi:methyl-accepting chemotaxis protein